MNFEEAKALLDASFRWELRDHAFGDSEFGWKDAEGNEIAEGYSGAGQCSIWFIGDDTFSFGTELARKLKLCGKLVDVGRNDETGPDTYTEGYIMPGLTKEAVLKEITTE